MVRNIVVLGGNSHPDLTNAICNSLGIPPAKAFLGKFSGGETRVEIQESVRDKDVFVVQSGGGRINDHLMELLIIISACKTASARRVTAVLPLFPYSRQPDYPYRKTGAPLAKGRSAPGANGAYETRPDTPAMTPGPGSVNGSTGTAANRSISHLGIASDHTAIEPDYFSRQPYHSTATQITNPPEFEPQPGYKKWVAQAGTLIAGLLSCAGADHIITMDLHDPQYQGFFDIPVDNLYGRHLLKRYIQFQIPDYKKAIIVSPDAGGAKRATAIADALGIEFALIHKERRSTNGPSKAGVVSSGSMMLVGDVKNRVTILIDDLVDTSSTITRAAKLLKREGATMVYALVTHGVLSGDAVERVNASAIDRLVVTNSVDQSDHLARCPKLEELKVGDLFAEVSFCYDFFFLFHSIANVSPVH